MKIEEYPITFLMPCFCAGGDPAVAEIRPSSIRGALRWWFRALGGTPKQEGDVFGYIGKKYAVHSSSIIIRVKDYKAGPERDLPTFGPNDMESYVWHFVKASGEGVRWTTSGMIVPGSKCVISVAYRRDLGENEGLFRKALHCFLALGAIGLRVTRGLGAFDCESERFDNVKTGEILKQAGFMFEMNGGASNPDAMARHIGSLVKGTRKNEKWINDSQEKTETPSPMGSSTVRQTSAIYFRPVKTENSLSLVVFEAPHDKVLGSESSAVGYTIVGDTPSRLVRGTMNVKHKR